MKPCECRWLSPHRGESTHSPSGLIGQHHRDTLMHPCYPNRGIPLSHQEKAKQRRAIHPREPHPEAAPRQQPPPYISAMPECSGGVTAGGLFTISSPTPALTSHQTLPARPTGQPTKGQLGRAGGGGGRNGGGATSRHRPGLPRRGNRNSARSGTGSPALSRSQPTFGGHRGRAPDPHGGRHGCGARGGGKAALSDPRARPEQSPAESSSLAAYLRASTGRAVRRGPSALATVPAGPWECSGK